MITNLLFRALTLSALSIAFAACTSVSPSDPNDTPETSNGESISSVVMVDQLWLGTGLIREGQAEEIDAPTPPVVVQPPEPTTPTHQCGNTYHFKAGLLRQGVDEALQQCGYALGDWAIGDKDYYIDYPIQSAFTVQIESGVEDVLKVVQSVYGVRGNINAETGLVDFHQVGSGDK